MAAVYLLLLLLSLQTGLNNGQELESGQEAAGLDPQTEVKSTPKPKTTFIFKLRNGDAASMKPGDTLDFVLEMILPQADHIDVLVEIFTKDKLNPKYLPVLSIYNVTIDNPNEDLIHVSAPKGTPYRNKVLTNVCDRMIFEFGSITNKGPDGTKLYVIFSVTMVRLSDTEPGSKHFVTAGAEFDGSSYLYIGQEEVVYNDIPVADDYKKVEAFLEGPTEVALDSVVIHKLTVFAAFRSDEFFVDTSFQLSEYEPDNILSSGRIQILNLGSNYVTVAEGICNNTGERTESKSGQSYIGTRLNLGVLTNIAVSTGTLMDTRNPVNRLVFQFSSYVMNFERNLGKKAKIKVRITLGTKRVWSGEVGFMIRERLDGQKLTQSNFVNVQAKLDPAQAHSGSLTSVYLNLSLTEFDSYTTLRLKLTIPERSGQALIDPCAGRLRKRVAGPNLPFVNSTWISPKRVTEKGFLYAIFEFSRVHVSSFIPVNPNTNNLVGLEVALKVLDIEEEEEGSEISGGDTTPETIELNLSLSNGASEEILVPLEKPLIRLKKQSMSDGNSLLMQQPIRGTLEKSPVSSDLIPGAGFAADVNLILTPGSKLPDLILDLNSVDPKIESPEMRLCRMELITVGDEIPCVFCRKEMINFGAKTNTPMAANTLTFAYLRDIVVKQNVSRVKGRSMQINFAVDVIADPPDLVRNEYQFQVAGRSQNATIWTSFMQYQRKSLVSAIMPANKQPSVTAKLIGEAVAAGQMATVEIAVRTHPHTTTAISLAVEGITGNHNSICGLWVSEPARNTPCMNSSVKASYSRESLSVNRRADIHLGTVGNLGPSKPLSPEEEIRANEIRLIAMVRILEDITSDSSNITVILKNGNGKNERETSIDFSIPVKRSENQRQDFKLPKSVKAYPLTSFNKPGSPLVINFEIEIEDNEQTPLSIHLSPGNGQYKLCDAAVVSLGENYPCYSPLALKVDATQSLIDMGIVCNTLLERNSKAKQLNVSAVIHLSKDKMAMSTSKVQLRAKVAGSGTLTKLVETDLDLAVTKGGALSDNHSWMILPKEVSITIPETPIVIPIRKPTWIPFKVSTSSFFYSNLQITAEGSVSDGRAVVVVNNIRIPSTGRNIPCNPSLSQSTSSIRSTTGLNSGSNTSQKNQIISRFAYIANFGLYTHFNRSKAGDDSFIVEVEVEMTDHPVAINSSSQQLKLKVDFGFDLEPEKIVSKETVADLIVFRDGQEKSDIRTRIWIQNPKEVYSRGEVIHGSISVQHNDESRLEPMNALLRIYLPPYISFLNLSSLPVFSPTGTRKNGTSLDIVFPAILFSDHILLNFSLINDPDNLRGYGQPSIMATTPYTLFCVSPHNADQTTNDQEKKQVVTLCSPVSHFTYNVQSQECYHPLGLIDGQINDCQISGTTALDISHGPVNIRPSGAKFWSPLINSGHNQDYIEVDFNVQTRVTAVRFFAVKNTRKAKNIHFEASDDGLGWFTLDKTYHLDYVQSVARVELDPPLVTRSIRVVMNFETGKGLIGIQMEFYGCYLSSQGKRGCNGIQSTLKPVWYSTDEENPGPHLLYDETHKILYACDYRNAQSESKICSFSTDEGKTWRRIEQDIVALEAYLKEKHKVLVRTSNSGYLLSANGNDWEPINGTAAQQIISDATKNANLVERRTSTLALNDVDYSEVPGLGWKVNAYGLTDKQGIYKLQWGKCFCTKG